MWGAFGNGDDNGTVTVNSLYEAPVTQPAITSCPPCSYLVSGSCLVCANGDQHPGCQDCVNGRYAPPPTPWYKTPFFFSVMVIVTASMLSTIVAARINKVLGNGKK